LHPISISRLRCWCRRSTWLDYDLGGSSFLRDLITPTIGWCTLLVRCVVIERGRRIFADRCPRSRRVRARVRARHALLLLLILLALRLGARDSEAIVSRRSVDGNVLLRSLFDSVSRRRAWQRNFVVQLRIKPRTPIAGFAIGALGGDTLCSICGR